MAESLEFSEGNNNLSTCLVPHDFKTILVLCFYQFAKEIFVINVSIFYPVICMPHPLGPGIPMT